VTCFPQRWREDPRDGPTVLRNVLEHLRSHNRSPLTSVYDLATVITQHCLGFVEKCEIPDQFESKFFDVFASSIGCAVGIPKSQVRPQNLTRYWVDGQGN